MNRKIRRGRLVQRIIDTFEKRRESRQRAFEQEEARAEKRLPSEIEQAYAGLTLYALYLDPKDRRILRDVFFTYDQALNYIRDEEIRYFSEAKHPELLDLTEKARGTKPTANKPVYIQPKGCHSYGVEAVDGVFLAKCLRQQLEEQKRSVERLNTRPFSIEDD